MRLAGASRVAAFPVASSSWQGRREHGFRFDTVQLPRNTLDPHFNSFEATILFKVVRQNGTTQLVPRSNILGRKTRDLTAPGD